MARGEIRGSPIGASLCVREQWVCENTDHLMHIPMDGTDVGLYETPSKNKEAHLVSKKAKRSVAAGRVCTLQKSRVQFRIPQRLRFTSHFQPI